MLNVKSADIYTVILTGGIASGKSSAANSFRKLGVDIIDADKISHQIVEPKEKGWKAIKKSFGNDFFGKDGKLLRKKLGGLIFSDAEQREKLESLLHPLIRKEIQSQLKQSQSDYAILDIPLYSEHSDNYQADRILVIDIPKSLQISRLVQRDEITKKEAHNILNAQTSRTKRLELADDIIDNTGTMKQLAEQVASLHAYYLRQSKN